VQTACLDGVLLPAQDAVIPVSDPGLLRGDGVFEVMRLYGGAPFAPEHHLERMARSAQNLGLALDLDAIERDVRALLAVAEAGEALLRVLATRGGHRIVLVEELPKLPQALALGYVTFAPVRVLDGVKSLSYAANMHAMRLARERGFDDALLVTPHGRVLELPTASLFWARGGEVFTPPLSDHILDSITRRIVLEHSGAHELATTAAELAGAEEVFAVSSVYEVIAVGRIEERELPAARPIFEALAAKVRARIESDLARGWGG
jgi:branched-chain amino acid aminotransferase